MSILPANDDVLLVRADQCEALGDPERAEELRAEFRFWQAGRAAQAEVAKWPEWKRRAAEGLA